MYSILKVAAAVASLSLVLSGASALQCYQCDVDRCDKITCDVNGEPACYDIRLSLKPGMFLRGSGCIEYKSCANSQSYYEKMFSEAKAKFPEDISKIDHMLLMLKMRPAFSVEACCTTDLCNSNEAAKLA